MMADDNKRVVQRFISVWDAGTAERDAIIDQLADPDLIVAYPVMPAPAHGPEAFKETLAMVHAGFPDLRLEVEDLIAEGDRVAARWTLRGTQRGELIGIPATNKAVAWSGMTLFRLREGKVVEERGEEDALGLLQQLGVIPAPGPGA